MKKISCSSIITKGKISPVSTNYFIERGIENITYPYLRSESENYKEKTREIKKKQIS